MSIQVVAWARDVQFVVVLVKRVTSNRQRHTGPAQKAFGLGFDLVYDLE